MPEGRQPRGVTPHPRSGAVAERTRLRQCRNSQEELPHVRGQRGWLRGDTQCPRSGVATRGVTPYPRSGAVTGRRYPTPQARGQVSGLEELPHAPTPEARGSGWEDQPHAMAAQAQEGLEKLSHIEGQEGQW